MKFPTVGTEGRIVLDYLYEVKSASHEQIRDSLAGKIHARRVSVVLCRRRDFSQVVRVGDNWVLTSAAMIEMNKLHAPALPIVPPREAPVHRPLNPCLFLNPLGSRPGSNDFRSVQSRY